MRIISSISAEELALLISMWGYRPEVQWHIDKTSRIIVDYEGIGFAVYLFGTDSEGRCSSITFMGQLGSTPIQFWHLEEWARRTLLGRLRRSDEGHAELDWIILLNGVTEAYIKNCFDMWVQALIGGIKYYMEKEDQHFGIHK